MRALSKLLDIALGELGVYEVQGKNNNERILEYHSVTTLNATNDETPWCSSFVNWVVQQAGFKPTKSAMAASWKHWGKRLSKPKRGCIIGYVNTDGTGHVGFLFDQNATNYKIIGGNQKDSVTISSYSKTGRNWFFVEPKVFLNSKTARAGGAIATIGAAQTGSVIEVLTEFKSDTKVIDKNVSEIVSAVTKDKAIEHNIQQYTPIAVLLLAIFVIYDRLKKERT